jgi:iron complex outermembrane receptor protein
VFCLLAFLTAGVASAQPPDAGPSPDNQDTASTDAGAAAPAPASSAEADGGPPKAQEATATAAAGTPAGGDEMIVTVQRYKQDAQKTPVSADTFTTHSMDQHGIVNLQDITKFTPNLELHATNRPAGGGSAYAAYIRGIGTGDFQFPTDPGVGLYVDDVYIARTMGGLLSTDADIERIEVVKGPQGTLFGRNTIGGAFNITTSLPHLTGPATGSGLLRLGMYGRRDMAVNVNTPIVDDVVAAKLSVAMLHSDGYGTRVLTGEKTNNEERFVIRGGFLFKLSERADIRIDGDYSRQDQSPPAGILLRFVPGGPTVQKIANFNMFAAPAYNQGLGLPPNAIFDGRWVSPGRYDTYALQPMYDRYDIGGGSAHISYRPADGVELKSITAVRAVSSQISVDGDQTPYSLQTSATDLDEQQYSQEFQFLGHVLEDRLTYMVGLYGFRETGTSSVNTQSFHGLFENEPAPPNPMDAGDTLTHIGLTATSYAAYTQETLRILPGLHLTLGARVNHDEKDYNYSVDFIQRGVPQVPYSQAHAEWNSFTPKAGLDWSPVDPVMLYASYSEGFKSGGFGPSNLPSNPTPVYGPENVTTYEVGFKTSWFKKEPEQRAPLMLNAAGFYNDYRDIQLTVQSRDPATGANVRTTENAGNSGIKGFEAELVATPLDVLAINGGVGYVDAKFNELSRDALAGPVAFHIGDPLPQIPDWSFNVGAQLTFPTSVAEISLRGDVSYKGSQYLTAADPTSYQAPYALYAARIGVVPKALERLEIAIYGTNLSNQLYYIYHATLPPTGEEVAIAGEPRLIFGTARYSF